MAIRKTSTAASGRAPRLKKFTPPAGVVVAAGLPLEVTFAPTRLNIHQLDAVIERARSLGAFRLNTGKLMRIGRAARLWRKIAPDSASVEVFRTRLSEVSSSVDGGMEIWHDPFTIEEGLQQSLRSPPATLLVLPNGLVKVVASCGQVCGDLRESSLPEVWETYRSAWRNETVIAAIRRAIADEAVHAEANVWTRYQQENSNHVRRENRIRTPRPLGLWMPAAGMSPICRFGKPRRWKTYPSRSWRSPTSASPDRPL